MAAIVVPLRILVGMVIVVEAGRPQADFEKIVDTAVAGLEPVVGEECHQVTDDSHHNKHHCYTQQAGPGSLHTCPECQTPCRKNNMK